MTNREFRLRRLFNPKSGRYLDIAVDHGFFGESNFLTGLEELAGAVQTLGGRHRPALVLRDIANVYGTALPARTAITL
ncbi:MAG: hypothetical protein O2943_08600 [Actinomycetota bacterium]|nr:hypothetical protein [Actinomycetota bacterium]